MGPCEDLPASVALTLPGLKAAVACGGIDWEMVVDTTWAWAKATKPDAMIIDRANMLMEDGWMLERL